MGFADISPPKLSGATKRSAVLYSADGGVDYSFDGMLIADDKAAQIKNMWLKNGILSVRESPSQEPLMHFDCDSINSLIDFTGCCIVHIGSRLYKITESAIEIIFEGMPDTKSVPVHFCNKLFFYCETRVFSVTRAFSVKEEMPHAPHYSTYSSPNDLYPLKNSTFKANILAPYISVKYETAAPINENTQFNCIEIWDPTRLYEIYLNGEKSETCIPVVLSGGKGFRLTGVNLNNVNEVEIRFFSSDKQFDFSDRISECTNGIAFGGGTIGGTRIILAGNPNYPGKFFTSELADALYFTEDSGGEVGGGNENITGFSPQSEYLLIFTSGTVSRMSYGFNSDTGGYFSIKTVSTDVGCDAPLSIASVDNRTVFASSSKGICIVDSNDIYDSLNIVPISANITDESGKNGWFSITEAEKKNAICCVHDRKYILCIRSRIFIWDFGSGVYTSSSDYMKSARKLKWFEFCIDNCLRIISSGRSLFALMSRTVDESVICRFESSIYDGHEAIYVSKTIDFGQPHLRKSVNKFTCGCKTETEVEISLNFLADGINFYSTIARVTPDATGYATVSVKLPGYSLTHFSYEIKINQSGIGIFNTAIDYTLLKSNLKD